jgi:hypothetical protein
MAWEHEVLIERSIGAAIVEHLRLGPGLLELVEDTIFVDLTANKSL